MITFYAKIEVCLVSNVRSYPWQPSLKLASGRRTKERNICLSLARKKDTSCTISQGKMNYLALAHYIRRTFTHRAVDQRNAPCYIYKQHIGGLAENSFVRRVRNRNQRQRPPRMRTKYSEQ